MRAGRLIQVLLLLQSRGRLTAGELAERLEVSVRTIQRDLEALSSAGIPVYAMRGAEGGWELASNFRTSLTGLTSDEAQALVVGVPAAALAEIGLGRVGDAALVKLFAALPPVTRDLADQARQRIHVDLSPWGEPETPDPHLALFQQAIWGNLLVDATYGTSERTFRLAPLGLVAKGMVWYLLALRDQDYRTYRVERFTSVLVTAEGFDRPEHFDLSEKWSSVSTGYPEELPTYQLTLAVRGVAERRLGWVARGIEWRSGPRKGWTSAEVNLENLDEALSAVLRLGGDVQVIEPEELRETVANAAERILILNSATARRRSNRDRS